MLAGHVNPNTNTKQQLELTIACQQRLQLGNMHPTQVFILNHSQNQHNHQLANLSQGDITTLQPMVASRQGTPIMELGAGIPADMQH